MKNVEANVFKETVSAILHDHQSHVITVRRSSLVPVTVCSTPPKGSEIFSKQLQVTHIHGPCSPPKKGNTKSPSLHQILIDDQIRVKYIHSRISNSNQTTSTFAASAVNLPANSGQSLGNGNFVVRIGIGTPKQDFTVAFDTGSDLTWIQCQPCAGMCYSQQDSIFNPSNSSTYSNILCGHHACEQLQSATGNSAPCTTSCIYQTVYADGSYSSGYFARDKLTLSPSDVFLKFKFGCGEQNQGMFGSADGLLGLGRNKVSMVSQTSQKYGKIFSYCLPSTTNSTGYLAFGNQTSTTSRKIHYTPLLNDNRGPSFYFLNLTGISVKGKQLAISSSVFTTSGTIIDSGTVITRLPPAAYSALTKAFRGAMSKYPLAPAYSMLDTCFNLVEYSTVKIPSIVFHFGGGTNLNVDKSGILVQANSTQYCLAFAGNSGASDVAILGNMQQQTFKLVYDVAAETLGFGAKGCS
ncbi:aspartyl protease family protein At5g10770-like [Macadamia integrifolia]|uniref:aspartyl protease family protein At5g10770-like n=1 Tax=Macadamia integrifolia TaxID=60698 RepID=UPI001C4FDCC4|nr:aspartyl protease family protein At5g10770-like [Macadamia integrifolia]